MLTLRSSASSFSAQSGLSVNGVRVKRNPARQAKALARWLGDQLFESTGKRFPGFRSDRWSSAWLVRGGPRKVHARGGAIEREPVVLKTEDVALVSSRIIKDLQKL